jgi:hypothetical protein
MSSATKHAVEKNGHGIKSTHVCSGTPLKNSTCIIGSV